MSQSVYRLLTDEEVKALSPKERAVYRSERKRFDAEVARHVRHGQEHGWIDVGTAGREVKYYVGRNRAREPEAT